NFGRHGGKGQDAVAVSVADGRERSMTAPLKLAARGDKLSVLCVGAHSDDIEIGAGATLLQWKADGIRIDMLWCVLSAVGPREAEARSSAEDFLQGVERAHIETHHFRDGFFPAQSAE